VIQQTIGNIRYRLHKAQLSVKL